MLHGILYDRYGNVRDTCMLSIFGVQNYLVLLVWATRLPEIHDRDEKFHHFRLKLSIAVSQFSFATFNFNSSVRDRENWNIAFVVLVALFFEFSLSFCLYKLLNAVTFILRREYEDTQSLSRRLISKLLGAIPFVIYFLSEALNANTARFFLADELCHYIPGAYKNFNSKRNFFSESEKYKWENCSKSNYIKYYTSHPKNTPESILKNNIDRYQEYNSYRYLANLQLAQLCILYLSSQIIFRVRRLTIDDMLLLNVNSIEVVFIVIILLQLCTLLILASLSMESQTYSSFSTITYNCLFFYYVLWFIWGLLLVYIVRDTSTTLNKVEKSDDPAILTKNKVDGKNVLQRRSGDGFSSRKRRVTKKLIDQLYRRINNLENLCHAQNLQLNNACKEIDSLKEGTADILKRKKHDKIYCYF